MRSRYGPSPLFLCTTWRKSRDDIYAFFYCASFLLSQLPTTKIFSTEGKKKKERKNMRRIKRGWLGLQAASWREIVQQTVDHLFRGFAYLLFAWIYQQRGPFPVCLLLCKSLFRTRFRYCFRFTACLFRSCFFPLHSLSSSSVFSASFSHGTDQGPSHLGAILVFLGLLFFYIFQATATTYIARRTFLPVFFLPLFT